MTEKQNKSLIEKLKNNKSLQKVIILILAIIALLILLVSTFTSGKETVSDEFSTDTFVSSLESRLSKTLSQVDGAGQVSVVITVESGKETVLAIKKTTIESESGVEITETPILVNGKTVVLKENYPKVLGVLIVAEGAKNISVLSRIQQATMSLLDIKLNQIEILTMK